MPSRHLQRATDCVDRARSAWFTGGEGGVVQGMSLGTLSTRLPSKFHLSTFWNHVLPMLNAEQGTKVGICGVHPSPVEAARRGAGEPLRVRAKPPISGSRPLEVLLGLCLALAPFAVGCDQQDPDLVEESDGAGQAQGEAGKAQGGAGDASGETGQAQGAGAGSAAEAPEDGWPGGESYYPLVEGAHWVFRHEGGSTVWDEEVRVEVQDGKLVLVDSPSPSGSSSEDELAMVGTAVMRVSKTSLTAGQAEQSVDYDPGFARFDASWLTREAGYSETLSYARKEWDGAGQLVKDGERSHTFIIESVDAEVEVPAGKFTSCLLVQRLRERGVEDDPDEGDDKRYWFCPGIGKVREEEPASGKTEELLSCEVPGGACP